MKHILSLTLAFSSVLASAATTENGYLKNPSKEQREVDILSFTDLARDLSAANNSADSTACGKLEMVWDRIEGTSQEADALYAPEADFKDVVTFGNGSALRFWKIFKGWTSFDWTGSNAKDAANYGSEIRPYREGHLRDTVRLTHRFGVNVKLSYVPLEGAKELGLTGQYATRNDCVLGRLSSAVPTSVADRFTPAIATKFFMDGKNESQVLIAQHDIGGQSWEKDAAGKPIIDNNFYSKYLSNRLSFEKGALSGVGAFSRFFYTAQYFSRNILGLSYIFDPRELQANHLAEMDVTGQKISAPKGPRFVWMVPPSAETKEMFRKKAQSDLDFRRHFLALNDSLTPGQDALFLVYGSDTWTYEPETEAKLIGKLVVNSKYVVSEAADVRLFYKHAIQFNKIPEEVGEVSPYTQDYAFSDWTDSLFTTDCALGIIGKEVYPVDKLIFYGNEKKVPFVDFSQGSLEGTFLTGATIDPRTLRLSRNHEWCLKNFVEKKLGSTFSDLMKKKSN